MKSSGTANQGTTGAARKTGGSSSGNMGQGQSGGR
jgi:hypothetical protein